MKELLLNVETAIGADELEDRVKKGKRLKVKFGVDPTRPDLTFGHLVVLNKLRQFQELGHEAILLIGDYTAQIGDPSGRSDLRPVLTKEQVDENAATYLDQAFKILDRDKTTVRRNSEWFDEMTFVDCLKLARKMTVARMLERDDFSKRYSENTPISIIEFLYPLIQGYDSVVLESDVELGGSDQLFNMLVGRTLQKDKEQNQQTVLTLPLLVGLDGKRKMSKSYDNYIAFNDSAKDMFGKLMSIQDEVMKVYYQLLLGKEDKELGSLHKTHPMEMKKNLAVELTTVFYDNETAVHELKQFEKVFSKNKVPDEIELFKWDDICFDDGISLIDGIFASKYLKSKGEARRLIKQGAIRINQEQNLDPFYKIYKSSLPVIVQIGKRKFFKIID
ncbi:MAG: tyrosine--tRNA ligase [Opitutae bacterium]|nr:tyrosine--tRNA ligase [Opitutae bacterium]|tara:strand:+ start:1491 stop:2660 length:1170 start_codon:yes stop_codon:yes gene_type:complete